jgi:hypothetical protein
VGQAAHLLGISRARAYVWAKAGTLPGLVHDLPGTWLVNRRALQRFLDGDLTTLVAANDHPEGGAKRA